MIAWLLSIGFVTWSIIVFFLGYKTGINEERERDEIDITQEIREIDLELKKRDEIIQKRLHNP